jgi:hypothetical protein
MITQEQIEKNQIILSKKILLECCKENNIDKKIYEKIDDSKKKQ